jgi:alanyl-tRNA synthetase
MGLERIAAVLQHVHSNYEIDLFQNLIKGVARETGCKELTNPSLRVIADHIRACSFLVVDGVIPGNEGRGYVLRRIVRRALRHGNKLGQTQPFFYKCVADLVKQMGEAYPELVRESARVAATLKQEEERFGETLEKGMGILNAALAVLAKGSKLDGQTAFTLYDTFGFPLDLTADVCRERGVEIDEAGFEVAMTRQREQARAAGKFKAVETLEYSGEPTTFVGYETLSQSAKITALYRDGLAVQSVQTGDHAVVVLSKTPFYAESGGQVGDAGGLSASHATFVVEDTQKISADVFGHHGVVLSGELKVGEEIKASVDLVRRAHTVRNHSATHLLHKALREVLGTHVQQKGSLVDAEKTRFDFSHNQAVSDDEIRRIEEIVNAEILSNQATRAQVMAFDDAIAHGAMALFGEKYGDQVRVLDIGSSCELCGGTHVSRTGDIGLFKITSESGVAAGIRRIEAVTGENALSLLQSLEERMAQAATLIKAPPTELPARLAQIMDNVRAMEKEITRLKSKLAASAGDDLVGQAIDVGGVKVLAVQIDGADVASMRETLDKLKGALKSAAIVLAAVDSGKVTLIAGVTADLIQTLKAGELVNHVALQVGGKGGGRPDMAQAGGTDPSNLPKALASVKAFVEAKR